MTNNVVSLAGPLEGLVEVATLADVPSLAALGEAFHRASSYSHLDFSCTKVEALLTHLISDSSGVVFVSRRDGEIVGACAGVVVPSWFGDDLIGMDFAVFVEPGARNETRGTTLILAFARYCQRRGARMVKTSIPAGGDVESTSRLYRSLGFVDAGVGIVKGL